MVFRKGRAASVIYIEVVVRFNIALPTYKKARAFIAWADENGYHHNWHYIDSGSDVCFEIEDEQQAILIMLKWS